MNDNSSPSAEEKISQPRFEIQRLYVREQSCKLPHAPNVFQEEWKPDIQIEMNIKYDKIGVSVYDVALKLTLTAKNNQHTAFLVDVQQAGIFILENFKEAQLDSLLNVHCPTILYPYARKVIADAIYAAGFPSIVLAPISFEGLYHQQQAQQRKSGNVTPAHKMEASVVGQEE